MKINDKILNQINELKKDVELYLSDYGIWDKRNYNIETDYYDDKSNKVLIELKIPTQYNDNKTFQLNFEVTEDSYKLLDHENENGEEVNGESLWRALFFQVL